MKTPFSLALVALAVALALAAAAACGACARPEPDAALPAVRATTPPSGDAASRAGSDADRTPGASPEAPPLAAIVGDPEATIWEYLEAKYDRDGDGTILAAEYGRGEEPFARLDADGSGTLEEADFRSANPLEGRMRSLRTQMAMMASFQADADQRVLTADELSWALGQRDLNGDGHVDRSEFEGGAQEVGDDLAFLLRGHDLYDVLLGDLDEDADGELSFGELTGYLAEQLDSAGVWKLRDPRGPGGAARAARSGPAEGSWAPDFTLSTPDGAKSVTLSSFRDERPVALIFGSYT